MLYLVALHLGGTLQTLGHGLRGETLLIGILDGVAHKVVVLEHQPSVGRQEAQQRLLLLDARQLRHDVYPATTLLRQLVLHLEGADGVYLVAEEVDAEGKLVTEGEDVEDAAAQGKLPRLVDVVDLVETEVAQCLQHLVDIGRLALLQRQRAVVEVLARHHHLGQCLGIGDDEQTATFHGTMYIVHGRQHLGTQYLAGRVLLAVLDGPPIRRGEVEHGRLAHDLAQVVVEVARLVDILKHEKHCLTRLLS